MNAAHEQRRSFVWKYTFVMTLKTTLSPELFDHPTLYGLYHTFLRCTLVLSSLLFPFTLYMIYTQSPPQLRTYSVYLSVQLSWAYAFRVSLTVTELVPLFPLLVSQRTPYAI